MNYKKNLCAQMRNIVIVDGDAMTDENLVKAVTLNENLKAYGYCLKPADIVRVAKSKSLDTLFEEFKTLQSSVEAKPMYPNFPSQVMNMDEGMFRMHQLMHYFSTYGVEALFGCEVSRGWLPDVDDTEKAAEDLTLLDTKVLQVISEEEMYSLPLKKLLTKKERMTLPEAEIAVQAVQHVPVKTLNEITIPFKENMSLVFCRIAAELEPEKALPALVSVCQHSGDAWRCLSAFLKANNYHLSTAQKKLMVKVLESFPAEDFEANLCLSGAKSSSVIRKLEFLSFNRFSRKASHKEAVRKLRNGELVSWNGQVERLLADDSEKALDFIAKRPGMLVRLAARLVRMGFSPDEIKHRLCANASSLSMQTLINLLNFFIDPAIREEREEAEAVFSIMHEALLEKMKTIRTPFFGKRVFIEEGDYDFDHSFVDMAQSEEGGYIRSGLAYRLPDHIRRVRFFVYWDDERSIDIDLHAFATRNDGSSIHVGWNGDYEQSGLVHSGDITHSDAAEYLDIDLEDTEASLVNFRINSYTGVPFRNIGICFVGMTAVNRIGEEVKLYNPKNCFFSHDLRSGEKTLNYGQINVKDRYLSVVAKPNGDLYSKAEAVTGYPLEEYLNDLVEAQQARMVPRRDLADTVLVMGKPSDETEVSIIDSNFFCD